MTSPDLELFLGGAITFGFALTSLFFARFWHRTRDRLFLAFSWAFGLLGLNQALLGLTGTQVEERSPLFLIRLAAFVVMIVAIVKKNKHNS